MTSNAVAIQNGNAGNLAVVPPQEFDADQIDLIANMIGVRPGTNEFKLFLNLARAKRLDPLTKQIYCIKTNSGLQMFASIDGLRVIAQRTGDYGGQTEPYWCGPDGVWRDVWLEDRPPSAAKVGVWKRGYEHPTWGVATFKSYGANKKNNWLSMPDVMLAKCAEALALRKAFPDDLSALYVREEFAEDEAPPTPSRPATAQQSRSTATPAPAEVVDAETGEIAPTKEELGNRIKSLRELLGWTQGDVRDEAKKHGIDLRTIDGLSMMVDVLANYGYELQGDDDDEDGDPEQGTLIDAETRSIDRNVTWD